MGSKSRLQSGTTGDRNREEGGCRAPGRGCLWEESIPGQAERAQAPVGHSSPVGLLPWGLNRGKRSLPTQHPHAWAKEGREVPISGAQVLEIILPLTLSTGLDT